MSRAARPHLLALLLGAATLVQFRSCEACMTKRALEVKLGLAAPETAAQVQTTSAAPPADVLGLVARSILGVTPRVLTSPSTGATPPITRRPTVVAPYPEDSIKYKDRYDFVSIEHVLRSPRLMHNFHQCVMERGPCTSEATELRRIIPEAMRTDCAKCTERQRQQAGRVLAFIIEHRPEWLQELFEKFDPDGAIRRKYEFEIDEPENETL